MRLLRLVVASTFCCCLLTGCPKDEVKTDPKNGTMGPLTPSSDKKGANYFSKTPSKD
jgi:hypothetical protein